MLHAYFDESGTHDDSEIFVVAGLVSPVNQWERLTTQWQRILNKEGLTDFHMVDCANGSGEFKGWDSERRGVLVKRLIAVIKRCVCWRTWAAIYRGEVAQLFKEGESFKPYEYSICAYACASRVRSLAERLGENIPYSFEQGGRGGPSTHSTLDDLIKSGRKELYRMGALSVDDRRSMLPLQAADLHAYEVYRYFSDQAKGTGRDIRKSFESLLDIAPAGGGGDFFTEQKLWQWVKGMRRGEKEVMIEADRLDRNSRFRLIPYAPDERPISRLF